MSKVLYVKANAKPEGVSRTFKISDSFIKHTSKAILKIKLLLWIYIKRI